jgi:hypothetical protein
MHDTFIYFKKLLQNQSVSRHVSAAATTIIREILPCKLEHRRYKTMPAFITTRSKIHFFQPGTQVAA